MCPKGKLKNWKTKQDLYNGALKDHKIFVHQITLNCDKFLNNIKNNCNSYLNKSKETFFEC